MLDYNLSSFYDTLHAFCLHYSYFLFHHFKKYFENEHPRYVSEKWTREIIVPVSSRTFLLSLEEEEEGRCAELKCSFLTWQTNCILFRRAYFFSYENAGRLRYVILIFIKTIQNFLELCGTKHVFDDHASIFTNEYLFVFSRVIYKVFSSYLFYLLAIMQIVRV